MYFAPRTKVVIIFLDKIGNFGHSERSFLSIELELFFLATYYFFPGTPLENQHSVKSPTITVYKYGLVCSAWVSQLCAIL